MRRVGIRTAHTVDDPDLPPRPAPRYPSELLFAEMLREAVFDENVHVAVPLIVFRTGTWEGVLDALQALGRRPFRQALQRFGSFSLSQRGDGLESMLDQVTKLLADGRPVIVVAHDGTDLGALGRAADAEYRLEPQSWHGVQRVAAMLTGDHDAQHDAIPPWNIADFSGDVWNLAHRPGGRSALDLVDRLSRIAGSGSLPRAPRLTLDDCPGMGEAEAWGRQLASDLRDYRDGRLAWDDVARGVLLVGPPGVGKTRFAQALTGSCGCASVLTSSAAWMRAKGDNMATYLKAMAADFQRAQESAPCILFIDEMDAVGSRERDADHNAAWTAGTVAELLEHLDGAAGREGIVVVAATNHLSGVDSALLRSGRLDRTVHVGLPDAAGLEAIFRVHLRLDLRDESLYAVVAQAMGGTGADIERWCREARRRARKEVRFLSTDDLLAVVQKMKPPERVPVGFHMGG